MIEATERALKTKDLFDKKDIEKWPSMKSIITKSIENVGIEALVSRRTYELFDRIEFLEQEIYPLEKGYVRGCLLYTSDAADE